MQAGAVYLGVGPEQNFTLHRGAQAAGRVIIFDIRRGNMHTQLMYKALFELATDRAEFVSMLFSRQRPEGLTPDSSVATFSRPWRPRRRARSCYKENY